MRGPALASVPQAGFGRTVSRQAAMVAYIDDFKVMLIITILCIPMLLLMRVPKKGAGGPVHVEID